MSSLISIPDRQQTRIIRTTRKYYNALLAWFFIIKNYLTQIEKTMIQSFA